MKAKQKSNYINKKEGRKEFNRQQRANGYMVDWPNGEFHPKTSNVAKQKRAAKKRKNQSK